MLKVQRYDSALCSGLIESTATTPWAWAWTNVTTQQLYGESKVTIPVGGWSTAAEFANMFNDFSITPTVPENTDPIQMAFSFDYDINLTGQAEPGIGYYSDVSVSMQLEYEDEFGDWQLVPNGQLFISDLIGQRDSLLKKFLLR